MRWAGPMNVTAELRALRIRAGLSQDKMAKLLGYKRQSSYRHYEDPALFQGETFSPKFVAKLAHILVGKAKRGMPPIAKHEVWRLAGKLIAVEALAVEDADSEGSQIRRIPVLEWGQIMGWLNNELPSEDIREYAFSSHEEPGDKPFVLVVTCDCMSGDMISPGDRIVCDPGKPYEPGRIVIAEVEGESTPVIGRYHRRRHSSGERFIEIVPSNPAFLTHIIDEEHPGRIIGRIVEIRKPI